MSTHNQPATGAFLSENGRMIAGPSDAASLVEPTAPIKKLVCRYCGSDDLAPSFKKRRDARCRACFKKRYRSTPQVKKTSVARKKKAAK